MENNLLKKMYFKPGFTVLLANAPANIADILGDSNGINFTSDTAQSFDGLLLFVKNGTELGNGLEIWGPHINDKQVVWIAYPKKTSGIETDLKIEQWKELEIYHLTPCGSAAIDETWTGLRIKPVGGVKRSGVGSAEIKTGAYAEFIDVDNRRVIPPADLKALLESNPNALAFFNTLAYTHKKDYVLWILTAKQEATRNNRLQKTIEMLLTGKKNPTMK
jgi:hypothetical protein